MNKAIQLISRIIYILLSLSIGVNADEYNHKYSKGDAVHFYVHKVRFKLEWRDEIELRFDWDLIGRV